MASIPPAPDPRTAPDDDDAYQAEGEGVSATDPAEGADDESPEQPGSPRG